MRSTPEFTLLLNFSHLSAVGLYGVAVMLGAFPYSYK
jgi:hypothetical protein